MAAMLLYVITHAHTFQDRATAITDWRLSELGLQQAITLAAQSFWCQVDGIVLSNESKTRLTVQEVLAQRNLPVVVDARFNELRRPGWTADYTAQVKQAFAEPTLPAGEWEAAADALARFLAGIDELCQHFSGKTLALVGHGLTLSLYRAHLLGKSHVNLAEWQQLSFAAQAVVDPQAKVLLQDFQPIAGYVPRG